MNNNLVLKPINDLLQEEFLVPSYQRGYRWSPKEVTALLDDIFQFFNNNQNSPKEAFYCLQPLVVSPEGDRWVLVDGQQRLTTIHLILSYLSNIMEILGKQKYELSYETRANSGDFLKKIDLSKKLDNIDYFHICEAYEAIEQWFKGKDGGVKMAVLNTILNNDGVGKNVKVIWYEVKGKDAIDIFTRINMGKIPLTNAELIKALFLNEDNFNTCISDQVHLRQLEIAGEWDRIENTLQNDAFWYFIYDNRKHYDTRIEFIFDLMKDKSDRDDDYDTFIKFSEDFAKERGIDHIWTEVKKYFMTLEEWFNDKLLYHLIGYSIATNIKIQELIEAAGKESKIEFIQLLREKIKARIKHVELDEVRYPNNSLKNILLLYNIETLIQNPKSNIRFPFDEYKKERWDIEHISSVQSEMPSQGKSRRWLENVYEYLTGSTVLDHYKDGDSAASQLVHEIEALLEKDNYPETDFEEVYKKVLSYFKEDYSEDWEDQSDFTHSLSNLTLLDSHTNRSYKNAVFAVKRKRVLHNDRDGMFVPICTKNVFLKYHSQKLDDVMFWQKSDANDYLGSIKTTLQGYY